jgi:hypothetical protein
MPNQVRAQAVRKQKSARSRAELQARIFDNIERPIDDVRLPAQRVALLAWADQYKSAGYRTLREQAQDQEEAESSQNPSQSELASKITS